MRICSRDGSQLGMNQLCRVGASSSGGRGYVSCIEEIAYRRGFIDCEQLLKLAEPLMQTEYGQYLKEIAEEDGL